MSTCYDIAVIGGGIVGLATARALLDRYSSLQIAVLEKERQLAQHQTGHNSGVIHSGIYYRPGSHKAKLCVEGSRLLMKFCEGHGIRFERCGKVIVATDESELPRLRDLYQRGLANGVPGIELIDKNKLRDIEPHAFGLSAIYSPNTSIVDYREVAGAIANELSAKGATLKTDHRVRSLNRGNAEWEIATGSGVIRARRIINCGGLYSDVIALKSGSTLSSRIIPFRGEYFVLTPAARGLVRGLIYPVPDPTFPFLGIHMTRTVHGDVEVGPNAVFAFAREGYRLGQVNPAELAQTVRYPGFRAMVRRYWRQGTKELYRSIVKRAFVRSAQRLVPELRAGDLSRGGSGVRAQAVNPDGTMVDDFQLLVNADSIHVINAPSPAATASLAIASHLLGVVEKNFS